MQKKFYSEYLQKEFDSEEEMFQAEHDDMVRQYLEDGYGEKYKELFTEEEIKKMPVDYALFGEDRGWEIIERWEI